jgi:hypothetical protein
MNSLPHGPLSLIVDFASGSNLSLLPIFNTCVNLKEMQLRLPFSLKFSHTDRFSVSIILIKEQP